MGDLQHLCGALANDDAWRHQSLPVHARRALKLMTVAALAIILWKPKLFQRPECVVIMIRAILFAVIVFLSAMTAAAAAAPLRIAAIGASNTQGWYVGKQGAYPAKLQALQQRKTTLRKENS